MPELLLCPLAYKQMRTSADLLLPPVMPTQLLLSYSNQEFCMNTLCCTFYMFASSVRAVLEEAFLADASLKKQRYWQLKAQLGA